MKARTTLTIMVLGLLAGSCLQEDRQKVPFVTYQPIPLTDAWPIVTPQAAGINADSLTATYRELQNDPDSYWQARSMSVFRNGRLVAESYFKDETDRTVPRPVWSCTKQVMGILIGIAIDRGLIRSVNDPISTYLPDALKNHPDKQAITIRQLLTMQSGIGFENYGLTSDNAKLLQQKPDNLLDFVLSRPMADTPGTTFNYKDGDPQVLSAVLEKVTGKSTRVWANEVLFSKIGLTNYDWTTYRDGATIGAFGILTTPRELAKIGQLVLNRGRFNNQQIVSEAWLTDMARGQVVATSDDQFFGYLWWSYPTRGIWYMSGNGGQFVMLVPARQLMVVFTAEDKTQGKFRFSTPNARYFTERIARVSL